MKKLSSVLLVASLLVAGGGVFGLVHAGASGYLTSRATPTPAPGPCPVLGAEHHITIRHDAISPQHTLGMLCDTLTITNADPRVRRIAFGVHNQHQAYDGISEYNLDQGQRLIITLEEAGAFIVHDHYQESVEGDFSVQ